MSVQSPPDLLATILAATRRSVEARSAARPAADVERAIRRRPAGDAFELALREGQDPRIIAECKRRSPSRGILRADYEPAAIASRYASSGAAAISVLTEPTFFDGAPDHLRAVREAVGVPLLRKDFIVSEYQLIEAAALGADAVLLIVAALDAPLLRTLSHRAGELGLACLVEAHTADEVRRAVDGGARIVGVNSRSLRTLAVDPQALEQVAPLLPSGIIAVAESGIRSREDIDRLRPLGYGAFLVGERLMTRPDPGAALQELRG